MQVRESLVRSPFIGDLPHRLVPSVDQDCVVLDELLRRIGQPAPHFPIDGSRRVDLDARHRQQAANVVDREIDRVVRRDEPVGEILYQLARRIHPRCAAVGGNLHLVQRQTHLFRCS